MPRCETSSAPRMRPRTPASYADDDEALRAYVLYPYLRAARLERALARAQGAWHETDVAAAEFLAGDGRRARRAGTRRTWLASLARRASWASVSRAIRRRRGHACARMSAASTRASRARRPPGFAAEIRARWLTGYRLPSECEPAFQWLRAQGELPDELVAQRAELLLDNGQASFARIVAARLPAEAAAPLLERADFIENPARMLDALVRDASRDVPADGRARGVVAARAQCARRGARAVSPR